jgi:hypothetical protein
MIAPGVHSGIRPYKIKGTGIIKTIIYSYSRLRISTGFILDIRLPMK